MIFGYARVSAEGRNVDARVTQLRSIGAERVFKETASGAEVRLGKGDMLTVSSLDHLARSTHDLSRYARHDCPGRSRFLFPLGDPWADTATLPERSMLTVSGGLAEFEGRGSHGAPREARRAPEARRIEQFLADRTTSQAILARRFNVSQSAVSRLRPWSMKRKMLRGKKGLSKVAGYVSIADGTAEKRAFVMSTPSPIHLGAIQSF